MRRSTRQVAASLSLLVLLSSALAATPAREPRAVTESATSMWRFNFIDPSGATSGRLSIFQGFPFDREAFHELEVVVGPGTTNEVRSEREPLALAQRLLVDYGPRKPSRGGERSLLVSQELDLANQRVCNTPTVLDFRLSRASDVSLSFRRIEAMDPDGSQNLGSTEYLIRDRRYEAGDQVVQVTPLDLPAGDYVYELSVVDPVTGDEDVGQGTTTSLRTESDSLPISHVLIKGVDLWDGHLTLSRRDLSYAGRGMSLDFRRSYSSHSVAPGPLGIGWGHSYQSRITHSACGDVILSGGEGSGMRFVDDGEGGLRRGSCARKRYLAFRSNVAWRVEQACNARTTGTRVGTRSPA